METIYGSKITHTELRAAGKETAKTGIKKFTISNGWIEVDVMEYGATITAIRVPDREGKMADVVLGFQDLKGYMSFSNNPYFGATVGRVANRIAHGKFTLDCEVYNLSKNEGQNTLHGGYEGFNRRLWKGCVNNDGLLLSLVSPHLDQGFPGELTVEASFILTSDNTLIVTYKAVTDRPTVVNMTSHSYFNLAGHNTGAAELYRHKLTLNANNFTPTDENLIPKGKVRDVVDTCLDMTDGKLLGESIQATGKADGFDVNFCVNGDPLVKRFVARLEHAGTGRRLVIHANQPGVQLYTANCLQVKADLGKDGVEYSKHSAVCLETQNYPNAMNEKHYPNSFLRPQEEYLHVFSYTFSTFEPELESVSTVRESTSSQSDQEGRSDGGEKEEGSKGNGEKAERTEKEAKDHRSSEESQNEPKCDSNQMTEPNDMFCKVYYPDFSPIPKTNCDVIEADYVNPMVAAAKSLKEEIATVQHVNPCRQKKSGGGLEKMHLQDEKIKVLAWTDISPSRNLL